MHYALHHTKLPEYMREMKKYHLAHHYKNFELGFGVTSELVSVFLALNGCNACWFCLLGSHEVWALSTTENEWGGSLL